MIAIIDYGVGNLTSIKNMLKKVGVPSIITGDIDEINSSDKLILPGVGAFDYGMDQLRSAKFYDILHQRVLVDRVPILGICLGVQLFTEGSEEGVTPGLGWIKGKTIRFRPEKMNGSLKIPHMGWSNIHVDKASNLFVDMHEEPRFYFVHTYHVVCEDPSDVLVSSTYGYEFTAGVEYDNIVGVQFHPEKSHKFGMKMLSNFANLY